MVGIGASAGGLKALEGFFRNLPEKLDAAFVVVQHLDPTRSSLMDDILARYTSLPVVTAEDGMMLEAGKIFLRPPDHDVELEGSRIRLRRTDGLAISLPIDRFFRSLAAETGPRAVAVVLSGAGGDGSLGVRDVNAAGGMIMVQQEDQAEYSSMPTRAIDTGLADFILPVERMGRELARYMVHPYLAGAEKPPAGDASQDESAVEFLLRKIRYAKGHDFGGYKRNTIQRRISRRMAMHQINTITEYIGYVVNHPEEVESLFRDLLINVTNFFRDPKAWERLKKEVLVPLVKERRDDEGIRIWVAGCATGEEAYTLGMLVTEAMDEADRRLKVKIFATDINDHAVDRAREGVYPDNIAADVGASRLRRFFVKGKGSYTVKTFLREMMIFAVHDLVRDPPFSRLDVITCRNLLIYMGGKLQQRIIPMLHYALTPGGCLMLGTSEGIGDFVELFKLEDKKWKIFRARKGTTSSRAVQRFIDKDIFEQAHRRDAPDAPDAADGASHAHRRQGGAPEHGNGAGGGQVNYRQITENALLEYSSAGVLLDWRDQVTYFHGDTELYLAPPIGEATFDVLSMARGTVHEALEAGIREVRRSGRPWRSEGLFVRHGCQARRVDVDIMPAGRPDGGPDYLLVIFSDRAWSGEEPDAEDEADARVAALERQLHSVRQDLQATIEELETSNEELKSANEEQQANNEELQSTNEELETSREELQSTNEELEQVNVQIQRKNEELTKINNDIKNLFQATDVGILFLDEKLHIKRFTPAVRQIFNLTEERDLGRPVTDISHRLAYDGLAEDARAVLDTLNERVSEVRTTDGIWFRLRIRPYRTSENVIDGLVVSFTDVTEIKQAALAEKEARLYAEAVTETIGTPLLVLRPDLRIHSANAAFFNTFMAAPDKTIGVKLYKLNGGDWDIPELRRLLEDIIPGRTMLENYRVEADFPRLGHRTFLLNARQVEYKETDPAFILLAFRDISEKPL
ncbi:chemotaxis protein CheB [Desulfovibrio sp. X2]|uniref:chemotaxis protein CheB n=1 Tax=Desulfovibrio sp. X2 TaxID=941449 RepID=UPI00155A3F76|nr:chemotaxis protein CheB [Desulfovibrio sp. X2]